MSDTPTRRTVLYGAGAAGAAAVAASTLAACGSDTASTVASQAGSAASKAAGAASAAASGAASAASAAVASVVKQADVPVGGGKIVDKVVITQPAAGTFKAFSAVCTHQGCTVSKVENARIVCACHNSIFDAATGAVISGPAKTGLPEKSISVSADGIKIS